MLTSIKKETTFSTALLRWYAAAEHRPMPWRGEQNPYLVWLSEVMMQQTRVEQGLPYFLKFKEQYPTVQQLADAAIDEVMRHWQGLGYYSRARNLHHAAKHIAYELNGRFPTTYSEIKKLKGVGPYTAAAIASMVYGERQAVVDGNVIRVLARVCGIATPFDTTAGKKEIELVAQELISPSQPGLYNQAIMDFGATVCKPQSPACHSCPLTARCIAYKQDIQTELPVRSKKMVKKERHFYYLLIKNKKEIIITKRQANDIWQGLYELPMLESSRPIFRNLKKQMITLLPIDFEIESCSEIYKQQLSHQTIHSQFITIQVSHFKKLKIEGAIKVPIANLSKYAFPKTVHLYLSEKSLL